MGIGWNILASLGRVALGFMLAAAVGIPLGFLIGRVPAINAIFSPVISLLRHVSPLARSEEHTSELQSLMRISYAVFCVKKKNKPTHAHNTNHIIQKTPQNAYHTV